MHLSHRLLRHEIVVSLQWHYRRSRNQALDAGEPVEYRMRRQDPVVVGLSSAEPGIREPAFQPGRGEHPLVTIGHLPAIFILEMANGLKPAPAQQQQLYQRIPGIHFRYFV